MANNQINRFLEFANMQMAAEAFLLRDLDNGVLPGEAAIGARLIEGNNHAGKFMQVQAEQFTSQYDVLAQYRNDSLLPGRTGFSGTLFMNRTTGELTLSFRSTEFIDDAARDNKATNQLELKDLGWGFGQIAEMEAWYAQLRADPNLLAGRNFNVTGYSLGGHLATAFNILRHEEYAAAPEFNPIVATYTFNGAGTGAILGGRRLTDLVADFNRIRANYTASSEWTAMSIGDQNTVRAAAQSRIDAIAAERSRVAGLNGLNPSFGFSGPSGDQILLSYQIAALLVAQNTVGMSNFPLPGGTNFLPSSPVYADSASRFSNMTEIVGMETRGLATSFTSNSGVHYGSRQEVHIEAQPLYRGNWLASLINSFPSLIVNNPGNNNFADTHSLALLVDSLSLMSVMEKIAPTLTIETAGQIFAAISGATATTFPFTQGKAEGDTLEKMLDALRKLVMGSQDGTFNDEQMRRVLEGNTWHDAAYRGPFQTNLVELRDYVEAMTAVPNGTFTIDPLVNASTAQLKALSSGTEAIAYRYALKELNPFAIIGNNDLYSPHNVNGELNLYRPATGTGLTREYFADRAEMLYWKNLDYAANGQKLLKGSRPETYQFTDKTLKDGNGNELTITVVGTKLGTVGNPAMIIFGSDADETLVGSNLAVGDRLYGGGGADTLQGNQGNDYLEGGSGNDTYVWNTGDGFDTILDTDGIGKLVVNGRIVAGGIRVAQNDYVSADRQTLHFEGDPVAGGVLLVNGDLRIDNFTDGDLGIALNMPGTLADIQPTTLSFTEPFSNGIGFGSDGADYFLATEEANFVAKGGDDLLIVSTAGYSVLLAGPGNDVLVGADSYSEISILEGEAGADIILGGQNAEQISGDISLFYSGDVFELPSFYYNGAGEGSWTSEGRDFLETDYGVPNPFYGTPSEAIRYALGIGAETDIATHYDDYIDGGGGNDTITGGFGSDVIYGGTGDDLIWADKTIFWNSQRSLSLPKWWTESVSLFGSPGDDFIDGGQGDDVLGDAANPLGNSHYGYNGGNDVLIGGAGNDTLNNYDSESESGFFNLLDGGDGNDSILSSNRSSGGYDTLIGGTGNDTFQVEFGSASIEGDLGSDTYLVIDRFSSLSPSFLPRSLVINDFDGGDGSVDRLQLTRLFTSISAFSFTRDEANLYIGIGDDPDWITVENWFSGPEYKIEEIVLDDSRTIGFDRVYDVASIDSLFTTTTAGTDFLWGSNADEQLAGGLGDDTLFGNAGNDTLAGGVGNDILDGGEGADIYAFNIGDGVDRILDTGGFDTDGISFGPGITSDMLTLGLGSLLIHVGQGGDAIHLDGFDPNDARDSNNIEYFQFADGTTLTYQQLLDRGFDFTGTDGDDALTGTSVGDRISGLGGNDSLDGGAGDDVLMGGLGNDTYFFGAGSGSDFIDDGAGDSDTVSLSVGVSPDGVTVSRSGSLLSLRINGTPDELRIHQEAGTDFQIEQVQFADGTVWDAATLEAMAGGGGNTAPAVANPIADQGAPEDMAYSFTLPADTFFDADAGDTLAYSAARGDETPLPAWLNFDPASGTFSGTPENSDVGTVSVQVTATDAAGEPVSDLFDFTVINVNDAPTLASAMSDQNAMEDAAFSFTVPANTFSEIDAGDTLVLSATQADGAVLPSWLSFDAATHTFSGTPLNEDVGALSVTVTATDVAGASAFDSFDLAVENTNDAPVVVNALVDQTAQDEIAFSFTVPGNAFSDPDLNDVLTYSAALANGEPLSGWLSFDPATRTFDGTPPPAAAGTVTMRVIATDSGGLTASDDFELTVLYDGTITGTEGPDSIYGTAGDDVIFGLGGNDDLYGHEGNDTLLGGDGWDSLWAGDGNDVLDGGLGPDNMQGQAGNDTYVFTRGTGGPNGYDVAWEFMGTAADFDVVTVAADIAPSDITVRYTPTTQSFFNDGGFLLFINGTTDLFKLIWSPTTGPELEIEQVIFDDGTIWDETILATMAIQNGNAPTVANPLSDQSASEDATFTYVVPMDAFADSEILIGDSLSYGASLADGSALPSWLTFNAATRTFSGTPANGDVGTVAVRVTATDEASLTVSDVFDLVVANTNDAPTLANPIADQMAQDAIAFSFTVPAATFTDIDSGDTLTYSVALAGGGALPAWLSFDPGTHTFSGIPGTADIGSIAVAVKATDASGEPASDVFTLSVGAAPDQTISGTSGNDTLNGGSGNDTINGLGGADQMSGGLGNDIYFVDNSGDQVIENAGDGVDTVISSITHTLGASVENLTLTGSANRNGTGNALDNVITGNSGNNTLNGGAGNDYLDGGTGSDSLIGGLGDDTFVVNSGNDSVTEQTGAGTDTVRSSISHTLGTNVEYLILTGTSAIKGTGNSLNNLLRGNSAVNTLTGAAGNDVLEGGGGNDALRDTGGANLFSGQAGADTLTGNGGNELFAGGTGNDAINTGAGADIIAFNRGEGSDTVAVSRAKDNSVSLGGGIAYADLFFEKSGNNLVLKSAGAALAEGITFTDWYAAAANRSVLNLQLIVEASADFDATSADALRNKKVAAFNFDGLAGAFDAARADNPALTSWALTDALLSFHLGGSDTEALGSDLAYQHGRFGNLANVGTVGAQNVLGGSGFGSAMQTFQPLSSLQEGLVKLT